MHADMHVVGTCTRSARQTPDQDQTPAVGQLSMPCSGCHICETMPLVCCQVVPVSERLARAALAGAAPDLTWTLRWASETSVAVSHGGQAQLVAITQ